jgi:hypothetical protein
MDVASSIPPANLAPILGDGLAASVARVRIRPPFFAKAAGTLDLQRFRNHDFACSASAAELAWKSHALSNATAFVTLSGPLLTLPHFEGDWLGGRLQGLLQLSSIRPTDPARLFVELRPENANLVALLQSLGLPQEGRQLGSFTGQLSLETELGPDTLRPSMTGAGRVDVREGKLFEIPFFGGLSKVLTAIIPGFGFAEQTDFRSEFRISEERIHLDKAQLLGNLISANGEGSIGFDGSLSVVVQVKLLKEGILAKALQIISWPITKLFEIKLIGTISDPQWRPENLPKELFLKFD